MALTTPPLPRDRFRPVPDRRPSGRTDLRAPVPDRAAQVIVLLPAVFPGLLSAFTLFERRILHPFSSSSTSSTSRASSSHGPPSHPRSPPTSKTDHHLPAARPTPRPLLVVGKWLGAMVPLLIVSMLPVLAAWPMALRQQQPFTRTFYEPVPGSGSSRPADPPPGERREGGTAVETHSPVSETVKYHTVTREFPSRRHKPEAQHLGMALLATALGVLEYGTLFFALGVVFGRPYMIALSYAVIFEVILGRTGAKFYVLSKFIRGAAVRTLDPVPSYFAGSLESVPSPFLSWAGIVLIPLIILGASALVASRRSYVSKGIYSSRVSFVLQEEHA